MSRLLRTPTSILVTGASGFLGRHVAARLAKMGCVVKATGRRSNLPASESYEYTKADLASISGCQKVVRGISDIVHCAGLTNHYSRQNQCNEYYRANVTMTTHLISAAAAAGAQRMIFLSSSSVYGSGSREKAEDREPAPDTHYAHSKWQAEQAATELCKQHQLQLTILRPAPVYGVGDSGNIHRLIQMILAKQFLWVGHGDNHRSLVWSGDVARAIALLLEQTWPRESKTFNIAGPTISVRGIVDAIASEGGARINPLTIPATPILRVLKLASGLGFGRERILRAHHTIEKWLSDDTLVTAKINERLPTMNWRDPRSGLGEETKWVARTMGSHPRAAA